MQCIGGNANNARVFATPFGRGTEVPISTFFDTILPTLRPDINLDVLIHNCGGGRAKLPIARNGRLWGYSTKKPSEMKGSIGAVYKNLWRCACRVAKAVGGLEQTFEFKIRRHQGGKRRPNDTEDNLPDAYLLLRSRDDGPAGWPSIAVSGAYNKYCPEDADAVGPYPSI